MGDHWAGKSTRIARRRAASRRPRRGAVVACLLGDEREPKPGPGRSASVPVDAGERLEDALALVLRDAAAVVVDVSSTGPSPQRHAHPAAGAAVEGRVLDEVVDEQPQAGLPAADGHRRLRERRRRARARMARGGGDDGRVGDLGEVDRGVLGGRASPRASACRPSSRSTIRRCSVSASPSISARRRRAARGGGAAPSVACTLVSGVRSSWPASAAKRRVAASARSRSAAERAEPLEHRVEARRERPELRRAASSGTRRSRSSSSAMLAASERSRRTGRRTSSAASHVPAAASEQRQRAERDQAAVESRLAALERPRPETTSSRAMPARSGSRSVVV